MIKTNVLDCIKHKNIYYTCREDTSNLKDYVVIFSLYYKRTEKFYKNITEIYKYVIEDNFTSRLK